MSGVLAGSLASSIFDPYVYVVGASGGVYALVGGYLTNTILHWESIPYNGVHLIVMATFILTDFGFSVYRRLVPVEYYTPISLASHVGGALAGVTIGYVVFSKYNKKLIYEPEFWICILSSLLFLGFAVFWNLFLSPVGTLL